MDEARWREVCAIFDAAEQASSAERQALLDELSRRDPKLRDEVASLLRWSHQAEGFLELPSRGPLSSFDADAVLAEPLPRTLGRYRLLSVLGHGGMSVVYLAERIDGEYEQRVAIKLLPRGLDTADRVARFRAERQILAVLDHPGIAKLLDGGTTEEGLPYLVMEYVEGEPIHRFARRKSLDLEQRLRLFLRVCDAVHFAHQRLIVHRDLKPSNLLVTDDGVPKLLDFGIAKLLSLSEDESLTVPSLSSLRPMTPEYASPEQVRGELITTATDIYSLGALLYELLTGRRAHRLASRTPQAIVRAVCDEIPEPPSLAATRESTGEEETAGAADRDSMLHSRNTRSGRRWRRRLTGDLDNIVLMALRKEPERRYGSVAELAQDIERFLTGLPVQAHRDSLRYRLGKFAMRNRGRLALAAVVSIVLATLGWSALRQRQEALLQANSAKALSAFLKEVFTVPDPSNTRGESLTIRDVLERGVSQIETRQDLDPLVAADLLDTVGTVYTSLGLFTEAETVHRRALARRRLQDGSQKQLASGLRNLGEAIRSQGEHARAEPFLFEAVTLARSIPSEDDPELMLALATLANSLRWQGELERSSQLFDEALELARPWLADPSALPSADDYAEVAAVFTRAGSLRAEQGRFDEAEALSLEGLRAYERVRTPPHPNLAYALNNLGVLYVLRGDYSAAEPYVRRATSMRRILLGDAHPSLAASLDLLALCVEARGRFGEAITLREEAAEVSTAAQGPDHSTTLRQRAMLAYMRATQEPRALTEGPLRGALRQTRDTLGPDHLLNALLGARASEVFLLWGEIEEARHSLEEIWTHHHRILEQNELDQGVFLTSWAQVLARSGDLDGAHHRGQQALAIFRRAHGERHDRVAQLLQLEGELDLAQGQAAAAEEKLEIAERVFRQALGAHHPRTARATAAHAAALLATARPGDAEALLRETIRDVEAAYPAGHPVLFELRLELASAIAARGDLRAARTMLRAVEVAARAHWGEHSPTAAGARLRLARIDEGNL